MANTRSAKKRMRQNAKRRARNRHWKTRCRTAVKRVRRAVEQGAGDALALAREAERLLRKAASKGVFHPRTVDRTVSRLYRLVHRAGGAGAPAS